MGSKRDILPMCQYKSITGHLFDVLGGCFFKLSDAKSGSGRNEGALVHLLVWGRGGGSRCLLFWTRSRNTIDALL